jgi:hypothetical protein
MEGACIYTSVGQKIFFQKNKCLKGGFSSAQDMRELDLWSFFSVPLFQGGTAQHHAIEQWRCSRRLRRGQRFEQSDKQSLKATRDTRMELPPYLRKWRSTFGTTMRKITSCPL